MKKILYVFSVLVFSSCSTKEYKYYGMKIEDKGDSFLCCCF